jgi:hypothetical protein
VANRNIFVAYPYSFPEEDYRRPFKDLEGGFGVKFIYADAEITSQHILDKITTMIRDSRFSLFDITGWHPNVTLELGVAIGDRQQYYLLFNPDHDRTEVPSDLGGLDRIQYTSYASLGDGLAKLLLQEFGVPQEGREMADQLEALRERVPGIVEKDPGLKINEIGDRLGVPVEVAQVLVRPLLWDDALETTGTRKGTRYYIAGKAPVKRGSKT